MSVLLSLVLSLTNLPMTCYDESLVEIVDEAERLSDDEIAALIESLGNEDYFERGKAIYELQSLGKSASPQLIVALQNEKPLIRENAAWILGQMKEVQAIDHLIEALNHEKNGNVKSHIVRALGRLKAPSAVPPIARLLTLKDNDKNAFKVRRRAVWALGEIGDPLALPSMIKALSSEDWVLRRDTIMALSKFKDESLVPEIEKMLQDKNERVREAARRVLKFLKVEK